MTYSLLSLMSVAFAFVCALDDRPEDIDKFVLYAILFVIAREIQKLGEK